MPWHIAGADGSSYRMRETHTGLVLVEMVLIGLWSSFVADDYWSTPTAVGVGIMSAFMFGLLLKVPVIGFFLGIAVSVAWAWFAYFCANHYGSSFLAWVVAVLVFLVSVAIHYDWKGE